MELSDELVGLDAYAVEHELALIATGMAEHADHALDLEARCLGRNQEGADTARFGSRPLRVGDGEHDPPVGLRRIRRPDLTAIDAPAVSVRHCAGLDHGRVR